MPKAKKRKVSPNHENKVLPKKNKSNKRAKTKQSLPPDAQRSHAAGSIVYEQPVDATFNDRDEKDPNPTHQTGSSVNRHAESFKPTPQKDCNGKQTRRIQPPEIQELRRWPDAVATVTAENFKRMSEDLQSNVRRVFQDLDHAMGQASAVADPGLPEARTQLHGRQTRAAAHHSEQFFTTLIPKHSVPAGDEHVSVQFEGTNTIKTDAPGFTQVVTFGNGRWSRTRNGVTESGSLDANEGARLAEQTRLISDGLVRHAARSLAGMLGPENGSALHSPPRSRRSPSLPTGMVAPRSRTASLRSMRGKRGNRGVARGQGRLKGPEKPKTSRDEPDEPSTSRAAGAEHGVENTSLSVPTSALPHGSESTKTAAANGPRKMARVRAADMF